MIGTTIREFEIQAELGAGGYGAVYRAHDNSVNRDVAIKVILPQYADNPDFKQRFESEAQTVAQLESRQIVPLYQYWQDEQGAFLVMRLIRGGSLRRIMVKQEALSLAQTMRIGSDIAEALSVAHENGVVHRDLKPENILIDERGNAYLTDFGIAKQTGETKNITGTDAIVGTWAYLSPEQIQNIEVTPQTDIYAFGIMLFEMLAGFHPFKDTPATMMVMKHLQEYLPDLSESRPDLPHELDKIIQKATAKDPKERYANALDMIADLKSVVNVSTSQSAPIPQPVARKKPTTTEERNRQAMLENVRKFWIEGVLENSVHEAAMIDLGMTSQSSAVDNPWGSVLRTPSGDEVIMDDHILNVFERLNGKLLIMGDPGSGKTTTLLTLASELLFRAEFDDAHPIPVIFNLSSWSERQQSLTEWLVEELNAKYQVPRKVSEKWVADDELLLLLDGLDEVAGDVRDECVKAINGYRGEHGFVDVVVCSRITDYEALNNQLRLNGAIVIQPLDDTQIVDYLDRLGSDVQVVNDLIARDEQLRELAHSPLMLSIMVLAYRGKTARDVPDFDDIEQQRNHLFEVYVERMFTRRVGEHSYDIQQTKHYLSWLAKRMRQHMQSVFQIETIQPSWLNDEQLEKQFSTQSRIVNSVFVALTFMITSICIVAFTDFHPIFVPLYMMFGFLWGWLLPTVSGYETVPRKITLTFFVSLALVYLIPVTLSRDIVWGLLVSVLMIGALGGAFFSSVSVLHNLGAEPGVIKPLERIRFSYSSVDKKKLLNFGLMTGLLVNLVWVTVFFPFDATFSVTTIVLTGIVGIVNALSLTVLSEGVRADAVAHQLKPNGGMYASIRNAGMYALASFVTFAFLEIIALIIFGVDPLSAFVVMGSFNFSFAANIFLYYGAMPVMQHLVLRFNLQRQKVVPRNIADFLDYSSSLILLRKVGGGYIFIHRYLLEYFADLETT